MLLQLLPRDITKHWEGISEAISKSLLPITSKSAERMTFILKSLIVGTMQCWVLHEPRGEICAIITTEFTTDPGSRTKNLLIFSLFGVKEISSELWEQVHDVLRKFAKTNGCDNLLAFTDNLAVARMLQKYGWSSDTRLLIMGVNDG